MTSPDWFDTLSVKVSLTPRMNKLKGLLGRR
jgi:hypothetical protein